MVLVDEEVSIDFGRIRLGATGGGVRIYFVNDDLNTLSDFCSKFLSDICCALNMNLSQRSCLISSATWSGSAFDRAPATFSY